MYTKHFCNHFETIYKKLEEIRADMSAFGHEIITRQEEQEKAGNQEQVEAYETMMVVTRRMLSFMKEVDNALEDHDNTLEAITTYAEDLETNIKYLSDKVEELTRRLDSQKSAFVLFGKEKMEGEKAIPGFRLAALGESTRQKKSETYYEDLPF